MFYSLVLMSFCFMLLNWHRYQVLNYAVVWLLCEVSHQTPYLEAVLVHPVKQEGVVDRLRDDVLIRREVLLLSAVSIFAGSTPASRRVDISAMTPSLTWFVVTDFMEYKLTTNKNDQYSPSLFAAVGGPIAGGVGCLDKDFDHRWWYGAWFLSGLWGRR